MTVKLNGTFVFSSIEFIDSLKSFGLWYDTDINSIGSQKVMKKISGNIWDFHSEKKWIVITTNIGWKKDGSNPMGAGIAKTAAYVAEDLPMWYGERCQKFGAKTAVCLYKSDRFILFPTKELNEDQPWMSWQAESSIDLIVRSTRQLAELVKISSKIIAGDVYLPYVGCENGGRSKKEVLPILEAYLDDRFVLVDRSF